MDERTLRLIITEAFSEGELRTLCSDLRVDYESLPAIGKADKARELVTYMARRDELDRLIALIREERPALARSLGAQSEQATSTSDSGAAWTPVTAQRHRVKAPQVRRRRWLMPLVALVALCLTVLGALVYSRAGSQTTAAADPTAEPVQSLAPSTAQTGATDNLAVMQSPVPPTVTELPPTVPATTAPRPLA